MKVSVLMKKPSRHYFRQFWGKDKKKSSNTPCLSSTHIKINWKLLPERKPQPGTQDVEARRGQARENL